MVSILYMLLNKYINPNYQSFNGIVCIVWDETFTICSGQTSLIVWWTQISEDRAMFSTLLFWWENIPSKHAASNPEVFWLQPVMAITTSMQPESGRIVYAGSNFPHPFQLRFFQRKHSYCTKPTRIWSWWPSQGLAKQIWFGSKLVCRNHHARFLAGCNWPTASFRLLNSVPFLHRRPR